MDPSSRNRLAGVLSAAGAAILFSGKGVVAKWALLHGADVTALLAVRMGVSLPCFAAMAWLAGRGAAPLPWRTHAAIAALGLCGYHLASWLDVQGLRSISVGLERIVLFVYPTVVVLLAWAIGRTRPGPVLLAAVPLTWAGIAVSCLDQPLAGGDLLAGTALVAASAVAFAVHLVGIAPFARRLGGARTAALAMCAACLGILAHAALAVPAAVWAAQPAALLPAGLILGLVATVLPALLAGMALGRIGPGPFAVIGSVGPGCTVLLAWLVLGERPSALAWVGFAITVAGGLAVGLAGQRSGERGDQLGARPASGVPRAVGAGPRAGRSQRHRHRSGAEQPGAGPGEGLGQPQRDG